LIFQDEDEDEDEDGTGALESLMDEYPSAVT
jgi:hypothetical protein